MRSQFCSDSLSSLSQLEPSTCPRCPQQASAAGAAAGHPWTHLDQPKRGGAAQEKAMTQVKAMPIMACEAEKRKLPMGLQTTM